MKDAEVPVRHAAVHERGGAREVGPIVQVDAAVEPTAEGQPDEPDREGKHCEAEQSDEQPHIVPARHPLGGAAAAAKARPILRSLAISMGSRSAPRAYSTPSNPQLASFTLGDAFARLTLLITAAGEAMLAVTLPSVSRQRASISLTLSPP